ncbi:MAG: hypothetical protein HXS46_05840 [Theionarchaea archaeon]|nr:MAG: hypothetical protein AYK18_13170 [Theionarchaea archaeon DG-70]MBU7010192.1 hypothetical protein [Theionarchaea archaeon]
MSTENHQVLEFEELYKEMKQFYDTRNFELDNVITDLELIKDGWTLHFVVDFYQVFTFAFPLGWEKISLIDEKERAHSATRQAARAFVFYGIKYCPHPVLIPPYATELKNWLSIVISKEHEMKLTLDALNNWGRSLLSEEEKKLIDEANEYYSQSGEKEAIPPGFTSQLTNLVNRKFLDMYFFVSGAMVEGIEMVRNLYRGENPRLEMAHERWKDYKAMTKDIQKGFDSKWYALFSKMRSGRTIPNIRDAMAIEIVMALNNSLIQNKELVLLVSDADNMKRALNTVEAEKFRGSVSHPETGKEIPILRTSDTFLAFMTTVEGRAEIEDDLERVRQEKNELADFYAIEDMIARAYKVHEETSKVLQRECSQCPHLENCTKIKDKLEKHKEKTDEIKILRLILNRFDFLEPYLNFLESGRKVEQIIEEIVKFIGAKSETLEKKFRDKILDLEKEIDDLIDEVEDPSIDLAPQDAVEFLAYRLQRLNGIPYRIIFKNPKITKTIDDLFRSLEKKDLKEIKEAAKNIFNLTHDTKIGNEGKLLLAVLLYCFRHYEMVGDITNQMLSKKDLKERKEFVLLQCLAYGRLSMETRSKYYYDTAREVCADAAKEYDDPRFHNMLGVIIATGVESGMEDKNTLVDALWWFKAGLERCTGEDTMLEASLKNNIAYTLTQKTDHTLEDLDYAHDLIKESEELWPRKNWVADFWDTDACIHLYSAMLTENYSEKKDLLKKARAKESKAKEIGEKHKIRRSKMKLVDERLKLATRKLKELETPG